ncbi:cell division protein ZipA [Pseudomonadota bacterium]|nr:cell division protein ZipA [Pseudomonadota bacterium]
MLDLLIIIIVLIAAFVGAAWYANRSSKQRRALLDEINNIEPKMGDSNQFGELFEKEMNQQTIDNERFDIDAEPTVSLSEDFAAKMPKAQKTSESSTEPVVEAAIKIDELIDEAYEPEDITDDTVELSQTADSHVPIQEQLPIDNHIVNEWEIVIAFTVMAREGALFSGKSIKMVLESLDLHFGDLQVYHRQVPGLRTQSLFSVANILDPGTLNPNSFAMMKTPGLLIFSRLPGPVNGLTLFDDLLDTAEKMADKLDGVLSDESRQPVNQATIEAMRSRILNLNLHLQTENNHYNNDY